MNMKYLYVTQLLLNYGGFYFALVKL